MNNPQMYLNLLISNPIIPKCRPYDPILDVGRKVSWMLDKFEDEYEQIESQINNFIYFLNCTHLLILAENTTPQMPCHIAQQIHSSHSLQMFSLIIGKILQLPHSKTCLSFLTRI
ncbi:unnamed protein product (macronuclear) [Paramecium tetraurelia]|uniref:Uncharacterized protein n=1 Tax=Paramecium tetraurelia TaxID=5888 RepID=A0DUJ2_PARTE|nr:uncharacterized protein GSPATT00020381001 [Paramecium tetraurelia]CAK86709.1 unnamed protein product [Paramecium tetraurelia]|eukprot:XP_001454106.1 hypothetical protein (macronuclear) [Paramecium tetraurelia strain d4-2]